MKRLLARNASAFGASRKSDWTSARGSSISAMYAPSALPLEYRLSCQSGSIHMTTPSWKRRNHAPKEVSRTDFNELNVLGNTPTPSTSVDICTEEGFALNSGITISGGIGALLVNGEAFAWKPWGVKGVMNLVNEKGQFEPPAEAFGLFDVIWPRPDLLVVGVGQHNLPLSPRTRRHIFELGMRVEVLDTKNAAAQFNLLATERGVPEVAAALIPLSWKEGVGVARTDAE